MKTFLTILCTLVFTGLGYSQYSFSVGTYTPKFRYQPNILTLGYTAKTERSLEILDSLTSLAIGVEYRSYHIKFKADYVGTFLGQPCGQCYVHNIAINEITIPVTLTKYFRIRRYKRGDFRKYGIRLGIIPVLSIGSNKTKISTINGNNIVWSGSSYLVNSMLFHGPFSVDGLLSFIKPFQLKNHLLEVIFSYYIGIKKYIYGGESSRNPTWYSNDITFRKDAFGISVNYSI
ncbi:MAG: hypothetical protein JKY53_01880 [Flavobacteriales bacterium]|nr:hypothetical protein [Flavobacteriales bacterium]